MSDKTVTRFKFFLAHQDEEQESWLRSMAQQGLHLTKVNPFCFWTFRVGEPADMVYRVNFSNSMAGQASDFRHFMEDAGWTLAAGTTGWQYWCTRAVNGKAPEIFTDNASKAQKFQQVLATLVASGLPMFVWCLLFDVRRVLDQLSLPFVVVLGVAAALYVLVVPYAVVRLLMRMRQLRGPLPA